MRYRGRVSVQSAALRGLSPVLAKTADTEVDIWLVPLAELTHEARVFHEQQLADNELARAQRYGALNARDQFVAARALLRSRLSYYANVPISSWKFETNPFGRPYIAAPVDQRHIRFSIAHTHDLVVCAIASGYEIGVDIENVTRELDAVSLARAFFAPPEVEAILSLSTDRVRSAFFTYWTLKESYIKARGMGMSLPLDAFWFELGKQPTLTCDARCQDSPARWQFFPRQLTPDHQFALAVEAPPHACVAIRCHWLTHFFEPSTTASGCDGDL